ncbi:MAG TPA: molybdopterin-binding protein, partial [Anaeromyxobacteraceae bacterium]|nr:molybdopterin-binding protein [Anaeromyxobacteraceae bacterium]
RAVVPGLLKIDAEALEKVNCIDEVVLATLHSDRLVQPGAKVAGCRVVPLVIEAQKIGRVEEIGRASPFLIQVKALRSMSVGIVTTGSEVYNGRIEDKFGPVLRGKIEEVGSRVLRQIIVSDSATMIVDAIRALIGEGADIVLVSGGMSVDPDDVSPTAIRSVADRVVVHGAPVLPGSMFMLAKVGAVSIMGLPGCVMYHRTTIFDLVLPRILAGEEVSRQDVARLGHGGLCLECATCAYPNCSFGKA